jgi:lanthionine-containing peptide SapB
MAILDLQGMQAAPEHGGGGHGGGSSASGYSCPSNLSVILCGGTSGLSVLICH